jgi:hypothetical protein
VLEALKAASPNRFRGIRHTVTWDPHPEIDNREQEGVLAAAEYRAGARVLARMGLSLDTGVCCPQLPELAAFARAVPDLTIILNHLGGLTRIGPYANRDDEVLATWRNGIAAVVQCPNVNLKLRSQANWTEGTRYGRNGWSLSWSAIGQTAGGRQRCVTEAADVGSKARRERAMTDPRVERRLAAVLSADVAGYSRLIGTDEEGTLARLKAIRAEPRRHGRRAGSAPASSHAPAGRHRSSPSCEPAR